MQEQCVSVSPMHSCAFYVHMIGCTCSCTYIHVYAMYAQGWRKHFRIGQAMKIFRSLRSQIFLAPSLLARLLYGLQMLMDSGPDGGILPILKAITCKSKIASALIHAFGQYTHTHTHTHTYNVVWVVGLVLQGHVEKQDAWHDLFTTVLPFTGYVITRVTWRSITV